MPLTTAVVRGAAGRGLDRAGCRVEDAGGLLGEAAEAHECRLLLVLLLLGEDQVADVRALEHERGVDLEVGAEERAGVVRYLEIVNLA